MKKLIFGVLSLLVPVALIAYTMSVFNGVAVIFGIMTMIVMFAYTFNKFRCVGKCRGYNKLNDALRYASAGNICVTFIYQIMMFIGDRVFATFNAIHFSPLTATVVYICVLGVIACITCLYKNKDVSCNRKALMIFLTAFAISIILMCIGEGLKPYGITTINTDSLSAVTMVSGLGITLSGYGLLREEKDKEAEYA